MSEQISEPKKRIRYSRAEVLACFDRESTIATSGIIPITIDPNREIPASYALTKHVRPKPPTLLPGDGDVPKPRGNSREDLSASEVEHQTHGWSRQQRNFLHVHSNQPYYQHTGYVPHHQRQRHPSGPTNDYEGSNIMTTSPNMASATVTSNGALRPSNETRRGGRGDWSRGCSGWRHRSYSGSEQYDNVFVHNSSAHRLRGAWTNASETYGRGGRGRGHGSARQQQLREPATSHVPHVGPNTRKLLGSAIGTGTGTRSRLQSTNAEEFWQDEDWGAMDWNKKDNERPGTKSHPQCKTSDPESLARLDQSLASLQLESTSGLIGPPPGFDLPKTTASSNEPDNENTSPTSNPVNISPQTQANTLLPSVDSMEEAKTNWYYIDMFKTIQGPFTNQQMATWLARGYLPLTIEIRRDCDECFLSLTDHMNLARRVPFWAGYNHPPITHENISTIMKMSALTFGKLGWVEQVSSSASVALTSTLIPEVVPAVATTQVPTSTDSVGIVHPVIQCTSSPHKENLILNIATPLDATNKPTQSETIATATDANSSELVRLYNEAQILAAHAMKVEAERLALATKLAAINETAAKLLSASTVGGATPPVPVPSTSKTDASAEDSERLNELAPPTTSTILQSSDPSSTTNVEHLEQCLMSCSETTTTVPATSVGTSEISIPKLSKLAKPTPQTVVGNESDMPAEKNSATIDSPKTIMEGPKETGAKKNRKKNKKSKKISAEQERQLAWEAEFNRRKVAALEQKLAEEKLAQELAKQESEAKAQEEALLLHEKMRQLAERRKREINFAKQVSELSQLKLPKTARWASATTNSKSAELSGLANVESLRSIQAAQATEEAQKKYHEALMAEQIAVMASAGVVTAAKNNPNATRPQGAWATHTSISQSPSPLSKKSNELIRSHNASSLECVKLPSVPLIFANQSQSKPKIMPTSSKASELTANTTPTRLSTDSSCINTSDSPTDNKLKNKPTAAVVPSIWNLPPSINSESAAVKISNSKKKKNSRKLQESASFAAREQLAHWCELQLSSMPLTGVDLPTLIDLLCDLQSTDEIVECIESSLGRSKRVTKFSKEFLEKRALLLDASP